MAKTVNTKVKSRFMLGQKPDPWPTGLDLALARERIGATQAQMGLELTRSRFTIMRWEKGGAGFLIPDLLAARWIDAILAIPLEEINPALAEQMPKRRPEKPATFKRATPAGGVPFRRK